MSKVARYAVPNLANIILENEEQYIQQNIVPSMGWLDSLEKLTKTVKKQANKLATEVKKHAKVAVKKAKVAAVHTIEGID
jgi:hypothetical protein